MTLASAPPRRIFYHTFGCRANQYDTERIRTLLELHGCETVPDPALADAVVINSCTVTQNADAELRRYVRGLSRRADGRQLPVVVAGCATAVSFETILSLEGVAAAVSGQDAEAVARVLGVDVGGRGNRAELLDRSQRGTRAWLKVQDGCDLRCSYCVIRIARGRSRSRPAAEIVQEARQLAEHHPEISLTGIHIGLYGKDLDPRVSFSRLVERLLESVPHVRFRIGSLECNQLDDRIISLLGDSDGRLAPHLHVPLQSGSDRVLRAMRRAYASRRYLSRVQKLCERVWPLGLGTDVIVGFPGEEEEDHRRTREVVEALPFTYVHVFPYSERKGTEAGRLADAVTPLSKAMRSREIRELVDDKAAEYRRRRIGTLAHVVLEGDEGETAVTGDYLKMPASRSLRVRGPRLQRARVEAAAGGGLHATAA